LNDLDNLKKPLFGGNVEIVILGKDKKTNKKTLKETYREGLRLQRIFNFYDKKSELYKLNNKRKLEASKEFLQVIKYSLAYSKATKGLYDITLGKNFLQQKEGLKLSKLECSHKDVLIKNKNAFLQHKDALIDLGSIAKGFITDKIGEFLKKKKIENFVINARGDILVNGNATPVIRIQHPRKKEFMMSFIMRGGAVATSGDYKQYAKTYDNSHILNHNNFISVTVIAQTLFEADLYATLFSIISKKDMKEILQHKKDLSVFTVNKHMKKEYHNNFKEKIQ